MARVDEIVEPAVIYEVSCAEGEGFEKLGDGIPEELEDGIESVDGREEDREANFSGLVIASNDGNDEEYSKSDSYSCGKKEKEGHL